MNINTCVSNRCTKDYLERINKVLEYIEGNIDSKLSLDVLANVAGFSPYHFHRIFHSIVGETIQNYVKKMRLATAAHKLLYRPDLAITDIALDCGFTTATDFARSFKAEYGMSASCFIKAKKSKHNKPELLRRIDFIPSPEDMKQKYPQEINLEELEDSNIAYIRTTGLSRDRNNKKIEKAFGQLFKWGKARDYVNKDSGIIGITLDNPEFTPLEKCRYDACITVPDGVCADGNIGVRRLNSKGKYAVYRFSSLGQDFEKDFFKKVLSIYRWWLPDNGYLPDDKPFLELFHFEADPNNISMDFCIPVIPY